MNALLPSIDFAGTAGIELTEGRGASSGVVVQVVGHVERFTADQLRTLGADSQVERDRWQELADSVDGLRRLKTNWDREGGKAPSAEVVLVAHSLGAACIRECRPMPHAINLKATHDGYVYVTLNGQDDREAELWVEDGSGNIVGVFTDADGEGIERTFTVDNFPRIANWLCGEGSL